MRRIHHTTLLVAILSLPLVGAAWKGRDLQTFFRFPPPLEVPTDYLRFSWPIASGVVLILVAVAASWIIGPRAPVQSESVSTSPFEVSSRTTRQFPWWGWIALVWTLGCWAVAWTRWPLLGGFQRHTFFPLWFGFIITVNAHIQQRTGTCEMRRSPRQWLLLFGASALFWWIFEWLNRFVHNWHYLGVADFGPIGYAAHATLCFSTVLPAVAAVAEWLTSYSSWTRRTRAGPIWRWLNHRITAVVLLFGGAGALLFTGVAPQLFYPALWAAPLAFGLGQAVLSRRGGLAEEVAQGDWRRAATWMTAALICGFFWEMWNWRSSAKWIYTVPGVDRWHVFEMPLLGYSGYLPFGLECLLVVDGLRRLARKS